MEATEKASPIIKKSPQELAAQVGTVDHMDFLENYMANPKEREEQYKAGKEKITSLLEAGVDDITLQKELDDLYEQGLRAGVFKPTEGVYASADLEKVKKLTRGWHGSDEAVERAAIEILEKYGYVRELRTQRKWEEQYFNNALDQFSESKPIDPSLEAQRIADLKSRIYHAEHLTDEEQQRLNVDFPGGNYLYHGTRADHMVEILDGGELLNSKGIYNREVERVKIKGRGIRSIARNVGYEGISWSMNKIGALPGDRYHIAGFLASPAKVLQKGQQLTVPSRPAPHEVIQINGDFDAGKYYDLKTQNELLMKPGIFGEELSVYSNLQEVKSDFMRPEEAKGTVFGKPMLRKLVETQTPEEIKAMVQEKYATRANGTIELSTDLLSPAPDTEIPPGAVWLQALIDSGRIKNIPELVDAQSIHDIVGRLSVENCNLLLDELNKDQAYIAEAEKEAGVKVDEVSVNTEDLYLVLPEKDVEKWLPVIARCGKQPKGIIAYNHQKVRLENWASIHRGDSGALDEQLRMGIPANQQGWIDWEKEVLGTDLTPDKMAGYRKHVIGEKYLSNRRSIRKDPSGNLVFK